MDEFYCNSLKTEEKSWKRAYIDFKSSKSTKSVLDLLYTSQSLSIVMTKYTVLEVGRSGNVISVSYQSSNTVTSISSYQLLFLSYLKFQERNIVPLTQSGHSVVRKVTVVSQLE